MGGVSSFILGLGRFLKENGFEITVVCTDRMGNWFYRIREEGFRGKKFRSGFYEWIPGGRILMAFRLGHYLRKESFDVIINNHSFYVHASAGYFFGRSRIIHVIHNQLEKMVELESDPLSDRVVGVSPRIEEMIHTWLPPCKVTSILNGVEQPIFQGITMDNCSGRRGDLLYVGRIDNWQKSVFLIPGIVKQLVKLGLITKVTIVGDGPDLSELKKRVSENGLTDHFEFAGRVHPSRIREYYSAHKVFLLPSRFEGHPLTLLEAMSYGCVPVCTRLLKCTDICIDEGDSGYLVEEGNTADFVNRIAALLADRELLDRLSKNAQIKVEEQFSISTTHQAYLRLIRSLPEREVDERGSHGLNRKYLSCKELVPFRLVMMVKRQRNRR
jgi:glycosyltransferase involved in cell wall biosynthesis